MFSRALNRFICKIETWQPSVCNPEIIHVLSVSKVSSSELEILFGNWEDIYFNSEFTCDLNDCFLSEII